MLTASNLFKRSFSSMQTRVAIIGAGPGGHTISAQLMKNDKINHGDVTVFDPKLEHHY